VVAPALGEELATVLARGAFTHQAREFAPADIDGMWLAVAAVIVGLAAAAATFVWTRASNAALTARDTIILADFLNSTGDPVFDSTLKVALAVALEQSPFLKVFPDERAHADLLLMQRSPDEGVSRTLARPIEQREQQTLVAGSITSLAATTSWVWRRSTPRVAT
jgi:hypothetical protein